MKKKGSVNSNRSPMRRQTKAQLTIFIIVGIVIVGFAILIYMFYPNIKSNLGFGAQNPSAFVENCLQEDFENRVEVLSLQGGSLNPENYILYEDQKVEYLCYTNEYYKPCVVQQPALKNHIEDEIKKGINEPAKKCLEEMKNTYEAKGYNVNLQNGEIKVELLPKRIVIQFNNTLTLTKENSEAQEPLEVFYNNNLYEFTSIAMSIISWETTYGDAETTVYMNYYRDLKVEKKIQTDSSTIYILTDRNNENKFQFASRSVAWPPGYGE